VLQKIVVLEVFDAMLSDVYPMLEPSDLDLHKHKVAFQASRAFLRRLRNSAAHQRAELCVMCTP